MNVHVWLTLSWPWSLFRDTYFDGKSWNSLGTNGLSYLNRNNPRRQASAAELYLDFIPRLLAVQLQVLLKYKYNTTLNAQQSSSIL